MWFKRKRFDAAKARYEVALRHVHGRGRLTLALARINYFVGFNVKTPEGTLLKSPNESTAYGVVHELSEWQRRVFCKVIFDDHQPNVDEIGWCAMTHTDPEMTNLDSDKSWDDYPVLLQVRISDPDHILRRVTIEALRDAEHSERCLAARSGVGNGLGGLATCHARRIAAS